MKTFLLNIKHTAMYSSYTFLTVLSTYLRANRIFRLHVYLFILEQYYILNIRRVEKFTFKIHCMPWQFFMDPNFLFDDL